MRGSQTGEDVIVAQSVDPLLDDDPKVSSVKCERTVTERENGLGSGEVVKSDVAFVDVGVCRLNKRRLDVLSARLRLSFCMFLS